MVRVRRVSIPTTVMGTGRVAVAQPLRAHHAAAQRPAARSARISPVQRARSDAAPKAPVATEHVAAPAPAPAVEPEPSASTQVVREHAEDPPPDARSATQSLVTTASQAVPATAVTGALPPVPSPDLPPPPVAVPVDVPTAVAPPPVP